MALDKIVDSGKLDVGLADTAATIGKFLKDYYGLSAVPTLRWFIDPQPAYYEGQLVGYPSGFAKDLFDLINANGYPSGGGGSGLTLLSGSVTPAENVETISIKPKANEKPFFVVVWKDSGSGTYPVLMSCYYKLASTVTLHSYSNRPAWAETDGYMVVHSENGFTGVYTANVDAGITSDGTITFGVKNTTRRYYAGNVYKWVAIYGEVYS